MIETEAKIKISKEELNKFIKYFNFPKFFIQENILYEIPEGFVRIRLENNKHIITLKKKAIGKYNSREELEFNTDSNKTLLKEFMQSLGLNKILTYKKKRTNINFLNCTVSLDKLDSNKNYIEVEGDSKDIQNVLEVLELTNHVLEKRSYLEILSSSNKCSKIKRIIVEGPDCSGKSTLVNRLKNKLKWDSKSLHHKPGNQFRRYLYEYSGSEEIVYDRSHFSEEVYSKIWNRKEPFNNDEKEVLDKICKMETIIIFACPSLETLSQRYLLRNYGQEIKIDELISLRNKFLKELEKKYDFFYLSKDYEELDDLIKKIEERVK